MCNYWRQTLKRLASVFQRPQEEEVVGLAGSPSTAGRPSTRLQDASYLPEAEMTQPSKNVQRTNSILENDIKAELFELDCDFGGVDDGNSSEDEVCGILI